VQLDAVNLVLHDGRSRAKIISQRNRPVQAQRSKRKGLPKQAFLFLPQGPRR
jgi:hypothetical protein